MGFDFRWDFIDSYTFQTYFNSPLVAYFDVEQPWINNQKNQFLTELLNW